MIDTESRKSYLDIDLVLTYCLQTLSQAIFAEQMDGTRIRYDKCIRYAQIVFFTTDNSYDEYYPLPQV